MACDGAKRLPLAMEHINVALHGAYAHLDKHSVAHSTIAREHYPKMIRLLLQFSKSIYNHF